MNVPMTEKQTVTPNNLAIYATYRFVNRVVMITRVTKQPNDKPKLANYFACLAVPTSGR